MALTPRCRGGGGENLSEELVNEDEGANGGNFEPLSDSCGESDMEGLDLSLFEPQVDAASWCDSRIHAGTLHILVHYCGKMCLHDIYPPSPSFRNLARSLKRLRVTMRKMISRKLRWLSIFFSLCSCIDKSHHKIYIFFYHYFINVIYFIAWKKRIISVILKH